MKYERKYIWALMISAALLFPSILPAQTEVTAVVRSINGNVEFRESSGAWQSLVEGYELPIGASISTGFNSSAVLELGLAVLEVKALSRLTIEELIEREGVVESDMYLEVGRIQADVRRTETRRQDFRLRSPVATAAVRGTSFSFDGSNLSVTQGIVELSNMRGRSSSVPRGYSSRVVDNEAPPSPQQVAREYTGVEHDTRAKGDEVVSEVLDVYDDIITMFDDDIPNVFTSVGTLIIKFE